MKTYTTTSSKNVMVMDGNRTYRLPLYTDVCNHSPSGFGWGYLGSGPAQLALAILCDAMGDEREALRLHQQFKTDFIAKYNTDGGFVLKEHVIHGWVAANAHNNVTHDEEAG